MAAKADLESFVTSVTCPDDFDGFWSDTLAQLAALPLEPTVALDPMRSNAEVNVYQATYRSLDGLEIFGWYSVPAEGDGPFRRFCCCRATNRSRRCGGIGAQGGGGAVGGGARQAAQQRRGSTPAIRGC